MAKIVQTESRAQVYLNALQRCSLSYAKIQIKSEKITSFGGIFPIMEKFDRMLSHTIDSTLGLRSKVYELWVKKTKKRRRDFHITTYYPYLCKP